jgi:hypothetical protein
MEHTRASRIGGDALAERPEGSRYVSAV